jgi:hypothetical protein
VIEQQAVDRARPAAGEAPLDPIAIEPLDALVADVFAGQEHHRAVLGEQVGDFVRAVEIDVVAIGPVQAADGLNVLQDSHLLLEFGQAGFDIAHSRLSGFCLYALLTNVTVLARGKSGK